MTSWSSVFLFTMFLVLCHPGLLSSSSPCSWCYDILVFCLPLHHVLGVMASWSSVFLFTMFLVLWHPGLLSSSSPCSWCYVILVFCLPLHHVLGVMTSWSSVFLFMVLEPVSFHLLQPVLCDPFATVVTFTDPIT